MVEQSYNTINPYKYINALSCVYTKCIDLMHLSLKYTTHVLLYIHYSMYREYHKVAVFFMQN